MNELIFRRRKKQSNENKTYFRYLHKFTQIEFKIK